MGPGERERPIVPRSCGPQPAIDPFEIIEGDDASVLVKPTARDVHPVS
jgi:hypothetical protein